MDAFPWIVHGLPSPGVDDGWAVPASAILSDPAMILDPKRWCQKYQALVGAVKGVEHFALGDVLEFVSTKLKRKAASIYRYVEIAQIYENFGAYDWEVHRGWKLPGRAKHVAHPGDIFVAHIWSSAGKWFMAGSDAAGDDLIVTSGCYHLRIRPGKEGFLPDLVFGFSTEAFRVQMRALATGSDGLSVVSEADVSSIVLPRVASSQLRSELSARIANWTAAGMSIIRLAKGHVENVLPDLDVPPRSSHVAQV